MSKQSKKEDFQLLLTVIRTEITSINNEWTILFEIEMISEITKKDWRVSRTIFNMKQFYNTLRKNYLDIPALNFLFGVNFSKISTHQDMNLLKFEVQNFLNVLIDRADLINSPHVKTFLELENHQYDFMLFQPLLINELTESMEITDFQFNPTNSLLFVGTAYSSETGTISSYISSFSSLWNNTFLGEISVYHIAKSSYEEINLEKVYNQTMSSQVSKLAFLEGDNIDILSVGLFDGTVLLYRIYANSRKNNTSNNDLVDQFSKIKPHKHPILELGIEADFGYIYTAAINEKTIAISEINYETVIKNVPVSGHAIACLRYDKENKRIVVIDVANSIWIMQINIVPIQAFHGQTSNIRCMTLETENNFLFTGSEKGIISLYDYNDDDSKRKFGLNKKLDLFAGIKVTNVKYKQTKSEIMTAFSNGSVAFWTHFEHEPEFVLDCHEKKVTKIQYEEAMKLLITSSTDKTLKLWHLPEFWPSETMRRDKETNDRYFLEEYLETTASTQSNMFKLHDALKNLDNENLFNEEIVRKNSKDGRESMITIKNDPDVNELEKGEEKISQNRGIYDSKDYENEKSDDSLDGWDEDIVERNVNYKTDINSTIKDLFLI